LKVQGEGETLRKMMLIVLVLVASMSAMGAMGCITCKDILAPLYGPTYTPTVASPCPTPISSPSPSQKYIKVETDSPPYQYMPNQARVSHPCYYRTENWEMPVPAPGSLKPAHHGVIHEMEFWNPTGENKTISVYNLKSAFYEKKDTPARFVQSYEMFYEDGKGFFSEFTLQPNERRTVLMYAYIIDDSNYEKYRGYFVEPVSVSLVMNVP
jgi:hypothetical protein